MLGRSRRLGVHLRRRDRLAWLVLLSLSIHLTLFVVLVIIPAPQPAMGASDPLSLDLITEEGSAGARAPAAPPGEADGPSAPTQQAQVTPPAPDVPEPPPLQQNETPPPTPVIDVSPPPPVQHAQIPPPTPEPDVPPPPIQQTEIPPPTPAPVMAPVPPSPVPMPTPPPLVAMPTPRPPVAMPTPPVPQVHPPTPQVRPPAAQVHTQAQRVTARPMAGHASANPAGTAAHATDGQDLASRASGANNGAAWMGKLKQWWDQRSFYPKEASQTNEGGNVRVHILIASDGQVTSIEVVQGSGSSVLDAAALAVFRNAHLPPFPPGTPAQPADVVVTLHYRPADSGG